MLKSFLVKAAYVLLGTVIICLPAIYNGYPMVYSDSGAYIRSGFEGIVPVDRPLIYGLFIRHSSLHSSLWFTVYTQSFLIAGILYITLGKFIADTRRKHLLYLLILSLISFFTGVGWYAGQLMPDIFVAVMALSLINLMLFELTLAEKIWMAALYFFGTATHYSHLIIAFAACGLMLLLWSWARIRKRDTVLKLKRILLASALAVSALLYVLTVHYTHDGGFRLSKGSHAFLVAHFIETGTLEQYLKQKCNEPDLAGCKLCHYKDSLEKSAMVFLWNWNSTFYKMGGWDKTADEYNYVVRRMNSDPSFFVRNCFDSFRYGLTQLFSNNIGEGLGPYVCPSPPCDFVDMYLPWESNNYRLSRQNNGNSLMPAADKASDNQAILLVFCAVVLLVYFSLAKNRDMLYYTCVFAVSIVILNSFLTAGINIPYSRLQARIVWIIPFFVLVLCYQHRAGIMRRTKAFLGL